MVERGGDRLVQESASEEGVASPHFYFVAAVGKKKNVKNM